MSKTGKICFIGEKAVVNPFRVCGADVYNFTPETWPDMAKKISEQDYQIIFITEEVAPYMNKNPEANVVLLPNTASMFFKSGKASLGAEELRQVIIKAVGTDILVE
ncbi:MAG: V-type ATP synthase subunit F [bacterium]|nr:V-type ATP synthase subunit F [bacterium]MDD5756263.1 V-type ATP synthase subunit F [bacterium]